MAKALKDLTVDDVLSVYSGKDRRCCCGCAGKHTTNPAYRELRELTRGYEVDDDECSLRVVKTILNKVKKAANVEGDGDPYYSFSTSDGPRTGRLYVVYLKPSEDEIAALRLRRIESKLREKERVANEARTAQEALKGAGI